VEGEAIFGSSELRKASVKKMLANDKSIKIVRLFRLIHMECTRRKAQKCIKVAYKLRIENFLGQQVRPFPH